MKYPLSREEAEKLLNQTIDAWWENEDCPSDDALADFRQLYAKVIDALTGYCSHVKD